GEQEFYTVSANSIGAFDWVLNHIRCTSSAPLAMAQELQASPRAVSCFVKRVQKACWRMGVAPSVKTTGGWSAGVVLVTVPSVGIACSRGLGQCGIPPPESKGRVAIGAIAAIDRQGIAAGSVHLWVSEGKADRNKAILRNFTAAAQAAGRGWILGGDFNMGPLSSNTQGVTLHRDYYIISKALSDSAIAANVQDQCNVAPRAPVHLRVPGQLAPKWMRVSRRLKRWPLELPTRCSSGRTAWPRLLQAGQCEQQSMGDYWGRLATSCEDHLNRCHNFVGTELYERK
ncbi:unnamed protein product, partial [Prorocentrum cordatum]